MTVVELIGKLMMLPLDAEVWVEGCDCHGEADGLISGFINNDGKQCIEITRYGGEDSWRRERESWSRNWEVSLPCASCQGMQLITASVHGACRIEICGRCHGTGQEPK